MVAVIKVGYSLHRVFNYNENKVKGGVAHCIGATNYPVDLEDLTLNMKLNRLLKLTELNENAKRNSIHISLNFDPSESQLSQERLMEIADTYMQRIGFGNQPYLVYQHFDAGHPHIHLVTTNIRADSSRIDMHHLGIRKSEPARKAIEKEYDLVAAEKQKKIEIFTLKPIAAKVVEYGQTETKKAIQNVLDNVLTTYRYASLAELNALLNQYNIEAYKGTEGSRIFQNKGLLYRILDQQGSPIGIPIKASSFYNSPTLVFLEERFKKNMDKPVSSKMRIKNLIDKILIDKKISFEQLTDLLYKQGIRLVERKNEDGKLFGVTYVDHKTKSVFNGSSLGKNYSAKSILERCYKEEMMIHTESIQKQKFPIEITTPTDIDKIVATTSIPIEITERDHTDTNDLLQTLLEVENTSDYIPNNLKKKKRKKKRRNNNNL